MRKRKILTRASDCGTLTSGTISGVTIRARDSSNNLLLEIDGAAATPTLWLRASATSPGMIEFGDYGRIACMDTSLEMQCENGGYGSYLAMPPGTVNLYSYYNSGHIGKLHAESSSAYGEVWIGVGSTPGFKASKDGLSGPLQIGFFGSDGISKPTVTGSRGGNAALGSLLTYLADLGLIIDSTSA